MAAEARGTQVPAPGKKGQGRLGQWGHWVSAGRETSVWRETEGGRLWGPPSIYFLCSLRLSCSSVVGRTLSTAPGGVQGWRGGLPPSSQWLGHSGSLN